MASIQHDDARKLLELIRSAIRQGDKLTYWEAARRMGRLPPQDHARTVAQMCDLLDAAACLAGVPLLALVEVREKSGEINPMAWKKEFGPRRDAIIRRSKDHNFVGRDFDAISDAITDLGDRGNIKAWKFLEALYPGDLLYRRLTARYENTPSDAISDLGTDLPDRAQSQTWTYARDPLVREAVLKRANGHCEYCGQPGFLKDDGSRYLESHHVIALAKEGADRVTNVIALCPNDHREAHYGATAVEIETAMILKLKLLNRGLIES